MAAVLKTARGGDTPPGFESLALRLTSTDEDRGGGGALRSCCCGHSMDTNSGAFARLATQPSSWTRCARPNPGARRFGVSSCDSPVASGRCCCASVSHSIDMVADPSTLCLFQPPTSSAPCPAGYGVAASRRRRCQGSAASASWRGLSLTSTRERVRSRLKPPRRSRIHVGGARRRGGNDRGTRCAPTGADGVWSFIPHGALCFFAHATQLSN